MTEASKRLVLLHHAGKDARAAWFDMTHQATLAKVAAASGYTLVEVTQAVFDEVDPSLPAGKLSAEGKPEKLHVMARAEFDRLLGLAEGKVASPDAPAVPKSPWDDIVVGSVVLASESKDDGWHECVVLAIEPKAQTLQLRWRDYPDYPLLSRPLSRVGLLPRSGLR